MTAATEYIEMRASLAAICHAWQRRPPFSVNLRDLVSLRLEGTQAKCSASVLH